MSPFPFRGAAQRIASTCSFIALSSACAEGNFADSVDDPLVTAGSGGDAAGTGGSESPAGGTTGGGGALPMVGGGGSGGDAGGSAGMAGAGGSAGAGGVAGSAGAGGAQGGAGGRGGAAGSGGTAGMGGAAGMGGSGGGPAATGHRFVRLVASSEQGGKVWSAVAELQLFTTGDVQLNRTAWVATADSAESDDESALASAAIDGNDASYWHSAWEPGGAGDAVLPHELRIDLVTTQPITGFSYLPRQDSANGRIADYAFYVSKDGVAWGSAVKAGTFATGATLQKIVW